MSQGQGSVFDVVHDLVAKGKYENYEELVEQNAEVIRKVMKAVKRIQRVAPDVALSPYVLRAIRVLREREAVNGDGSVSAAA